MLIVGFHILIYVYYLISVDSSNNRGLLVIPGLGDPFRLSIVVNNLSLLSEYLDGDNASLDCIVYVYAPRNSSDFWSQSNNLAFISRYCNIIDHPNKRVTENLYMMQPIFVLKLYAYVFILLDDCKLLGGKSFPLNTMLNIMNKNNLTVASPKVIGYFH